MELHEFVKAAVGVPFRDRGRDWNGWDCWGLLLAAYREVYGLELPDLPWLSALESPEVAARLEGRHQDWERVPLGRERPGDAALFYVGRWLCHVGLVAARGQVLHVSADIDTCVESYQHGPLARRLEGIYRHARLGAH